ncbi:MAG: hypothetical protein K2Y01_07870 [Rhabdochlamydiaceae bacterium]|nr:hypothetical protein [Rhabdochlamydiaceae bacterium]
MSRLAFLTFFLLGLGFNLGISAFANSSLPPDQSPSVSLILDIWSDDVSQYGLFTYSTQQSCTSGKNCSNGQIVLHYGHSCDNTTVPTASSVLPGYKGCPCDSEMCRQPTGLLDDENPTHLMFSAEGAFFVYNFTVYDADKSHTLTGPDGQPIIVSVTVQYKGTPPSAENVKKNGDFYAYITQTGDLPFQLSLEAFQQGEGIEDPEFEVIMSEL